LKKKKTDATDIDMTSHPIRHKPFFRSISSINDPVKKIDAADIDMTSHPTRHKAWLSSIFNFEPEIHSHAEACSQQDT
jgi:hypothetical protein